MQTKTKKTPRSGHILLTRIHHNRWLIWAITAIVLVLGTLFFYIKIANLNDSAQQVFINSQQRRQYSNQTLGFGVDYSAGWVVDSSSNQSVTFDNPANDGESISISTASLAAAAQLEKTPSAKVASTYTLRGNQVTILTVADPEGGNSMEIGIINTSKKAFVVTGSSSQFNSFVNGIRPL